MLHRAVDKHQQQNRSFGSTSSSASGPLRTSQPANAAFKNPFHPTASSNINSLNGQQRQARRTAGFKRTASGLAKSAGSSFEDVGGSQQHPITLEDNSPRKSRVLQVTPDDFIDENEFDSDIDLDIEEPAPSKVVGYPSLPKNSSSSTFTAPIVYPTLPRQQQAHTSFSKTLDSDFEPGTPNNGAATPGSSAPLPWSSSPSEHLHPSLSTVLNSNALSRAKSTASHAQIETPSADLPNTKKSRTIPWLDQNPPAVTKNQLKDKYTYSGSAAAQTNPGGATQRRREAALDSTPKNSKPTYPWNTTASAVKEQQKLHREQFKKPIAVTENVASDEQTYIKAKSSRERPARVFLSEEQQHVLNLVVEKKKSVFFTGSAGTGKSVLMREIINTLRRRYSKEPDRVAVTASTGLAACNVGGVTLHSFAGIGLGKEDVPTLVRKIKRNQKAKHRWMRTKVLVVDEVSMVDGDLFDKLEAVARQIRNNGRPFGGIQLVITGDFFQLPPVPDQGRLAKFAFDAATWSTTVEHTIGLHHVFRQKDPVFASMLNEMREGRLTQASIGAFQKLTRPLKFEDQLECTELYPRREDVERANWERLHSLQGESYVFEARDTGAITDKAQRDKLLSNCMAPESITLKKGAQVMLIKNVDETLVNGSIGQVMGLMDEQQFDSYTSQEGESTSGASLQGKRFENITTARRWPVVRFLIADGTTRDLLCQPETWKVEQPNGEVQAARNQVPLILAWALSIHKAQGQTLDRVKVDLGKVFEKGQAYVALSRATSMAGLQVLRFDPKKVVAHERVRHFYANLSRIELDAAKPAPTESRAKTGTHALDYEQSLMEQEWADAF